VLFTSGSTGLPKGAWFTDRQLRAITRYDVGDAIGGDDPIAQYGSTQFAHVGFTTKLPWYLRMGTTTHLLARWRAGDVLDLASNANIVEKSGAWYSYNKERIGQGRENAKKFLQEHAEMLTDIESKVLDSAGIKRVTAPGAGASE
jgi:acyl-CoA synthetase (AMP-forming)/AMP-acid ligase II